MPNEIDGVLGAQQISNYLSNKFKTLYNSVSYENIEMKYLAKLVENEISKKCENETCCFDHEINLPMLKKSCFQTKTREV